MMYRSNHFYDNSDYSCNKQNCSRTSRERSYNDGYSRPYERQGQSNSSYDQQEHVHEIVGSTANFNECDECHNHRFCTVSGEAIEMGNSHVHEVKFRTDFSDGHYHEFCGKSSPAIEVGEGKHIHFANAFTQEEDGHKHAFQVASLINSPTDC